MLLADRSRVSGKAFESHRRRVIAAVIVGITLASCADPVAPEPASSETTAAPEVPAIVSEAPATEPAASCDVSMPTDDTVLAALTALAEADVLPDALVPPEDGTWTVRHPDGAVAAEGPMRDGERHGLWRRWAADGRLVEEGRYAHDRPVGAWHLWGIDGTALPDVTYGSDACTTAPEIDMGPVGCGLAPPAVALPHLGGAGELRRCVAFARPWLAAMLRAERTRWDELRYALRRAGSPELEATIRALMEAAIARREGGLWAEQDDLRIVQYGSAVLRDTGGDAWAAEQELALPLDFPYGYHDITPPGPAARRYLAVLAALDATGARPESHPHAPELPRLLSDAARGLAAGAPELALAVLGHAIRRLEPLGVLGEHWLSELLEARGDVYLACGESALARVDVERAHSAWLATLHEVGAVRTGRLLARIAEADGHAEETAMLRADADALEAELTRRHEAAARMANVRERVETALTAGRYADAIAMVDGALQEADTLTHRDSPGAWDWGAFLRRLSARAHFSLGDLDATRADLRAAMSREERDDRLPLDALLADVALAAGDREGAERWARTAIADDRAHGSPATATTTALEALLARILAADEAESPAAVRHLTAEDF